MARPLSNLAQLPLWALKCCVNLKRFLWCAPKLGASVAFGRRTGTEASRWGYSETGSLVWASRKARVRRFQGLVASRREEQFGQRWPGSYEQRGGRNGLGGMGGGRKTLYQADAAMKASSDDMLAGISNALMSGSADESLLKSLTSLRPGDASPELENTMLMAISDTSDARLRNVLAVALADMNSTNAASRLQSLLNQPKTLGSRGTLLYALQKLNATLSLQELAYLILADTAEVQEEAYNMLEDSLSKGNRVGLTDAINVLMSGFERKDDSHRTEVLKDALAICLKAMNAN